MTTATSPSERITDVVTSWPGVEAGPGSRGEFAFAVGRRQIGHLHGDRSLHISFPKALWAELHEAGRIDYHPVFPGRPGHAARRIETEADVEDVIALLRLNYERATAPRFERVIDGLWASPPQRLPFGHGIDVRAFLLERWQGNLLLYSVDGLRSSSAQRQYLGHGHEAMFAADRPRIPLYMHTADADGIDARATFTRRHHLDEDFEVIPIPGHTPGSTAYLFDTREHRVLFTADSLLLDGGEWRTAVLASSDRAAYAESLRTIRELDFDLLVPWAAVGPFTAATDRDDTRRRIDALLRDL